MAPRPPDEPTGADGATPLAMTETDEPIGLRSLLTGALERLWGIVAVGLIAGLLVGGVGSRLAMLVLRLTSPDSVVGVQSDDGFRIGQVTLGGTYGLLVVGVAFGILGAAFYRLLAPWLIGPTWFRSLTTALGCGSVVGSMLVHTDGIDFRLLEPTWLAISLFVAVPAVFGAVVGPITTWVTQPGAWLSIGRRRWLPGLVVLFPPALFPTLMVFVAVLVASTFRPLRIVAGLQRNLVTATVVRGAWLAVAVLGLSALLSDVAELV